MRDIDEVRDSLSKIEERLKTERSEKLRKDFWKVVGKIKRISPLPEDLVERTSAMRNVLFEEKFKMVMSLRKGIAFFTFGLFVSWTVLIYILVNRTPGDLTAAVPLAILNIAILYLGYPFGRLLGGFLTSIRFEGFYRYSPGELGLKIEYKSYLKAGQKRQWMFACAVLWVFLIEAMVVLITLFVAYDLTVIPMIILVFLVVLYFAGTSKKTGELYRFIRERKISSDTSRISRNEPFKKSRHSQ